jgi:hypothetical protein
MSKCAFIGIPFQNEARRRRHAILVQGDGEGRRADRAGKRPAENAPRPGRRGLHGEAQRRGGRLAIG